MERAFHSSLLQYKTHTRNQTNVTLYGKDSQKHQMFSKAPLNIGQICSPTLNLNKKQFLCT